jgi:hypothetical protein
VSPRSPTSLRDMIRQVATAIGGRQHIGLGGGVEYRAVEPRYLVDPMNGLSSRLVREDGFVDRREAYATAIHSPPEVD